MLACGSIPGRSRASGRTVGRAAWTEAFDDEGMQRSQILRNLPHSSYRIVGMRQMSLVPVSEAHFLVPQDIVLFAVAANSSAFFTGLCEKESDRRSSLALSAMGHK